MSVASPMRLRDFALEARVRRAEAEVYSGAELAAARRQAFAEGEAQGRAAAEARAVEAAAERQAETERLIREVAAVRCEADALVGAALAGLEQAFRAALAAVAPGLARSEAIRACAAALRQAGEAVRLHEVEVRVHPEFETVLQSADPPLPGSLRLLADPALAYGVASLGWGEGGGRIQPESTVAAVQSALDQALISWPEGGAAADMAAANGSTNDER